MEFLSLLPAVVGTLPGEHGPGPPRLLRRPAGRGQPPVAVVQQPPGHLREMQTQESQDEQLVPEDVAPVRLTVHSSRRYTDVELGGVRRQRLQHMKEVQSQNPAR